MNRKNPPPRGCSRCAPVLLRAGRQIPAVSGLILQLIQYSQQLKHRGWRADRFAKIGKSWAAVAGPSTYADGFNAQERGQLVNLVPDMTHSYCAMVGGAVRIPAVDKFARAERKAIAAVGVANLEDRAGDGFGVGA